MNQPTTPTTTTHKAHRHTDWTRRVDLLDAIRQEIDACITARDWTQVIDLCDAAFKICEATGISLEPWNTLQQIALNEEWDAIVAAEKAAA